jgi:hypothetical protein
MPGEIDSALLARYLDRVRVVLVEQYETPHGRASDRERLAYLAQSFHEETRPRILREYAELRDVDALDAGIIGSQFEAKVDLILEASEPEVSGRSRRTKQSLRKFIKRAKILASSLRNLIPGAEALLELLDFADAVLDR